MECFASYGSGNQFNLPPTPIISLSINGHNFLKNLVRCLRHQIDSFIEWFITGFDLSSEITVFQLPVHQLASMVYLNLCSSVQFLILQWYNDAIKTSSLIKHFMGKSVNMPGENGHSGLSISMNLGS